MRTIFLFAALVPALVLAGSPADTARQPAADTAAGPRAGTAALVPPDTTAATDTTAAVAAAAKTDTAAAPADSAAAPRDSLNVFSNTIIAAGAGLSLGGVPVITTWKKGLPGTLSGLRLDALSFAGPGDSSELFFTVKENPDLYNMTFPVSVYFCRLSRDRRLAGGASFSFQSKQFVASIADKNDSLRHVDMQQSIRLYAATLDFVYGSPIPARYFSIDKMDRTDAVLGLSVAPYVSFSRTAKVSSSGADARMVAVRDSVARQMRSFSIPGIAVAWRAGIIALRKVSRTGGVDASLSYYGFWYTRFRSGSDRLYNSDISASASEPSKEVSFFSNRFEITFSLLRKL